ncbi:hypothetical protein Tco_0278711 [Tanacetum coccineum]
MRVNDLVTQPEVWSHVKIYAGLPMVSVSLSAITDHIIPMSKKKNARRFFPLGFTWEGFLKRQSQLAVLTPDVQLWDSLAVLWHVTNGLVNVQAFA